MECIRPNRNNILRYLKLRDAPQSVDALRFSLDTSHGCVWAPSRVVRVLHSLQKDGLVYKGIESQEWILSRKGRSYLGSRTGG